MKIIIIGGILATALLLGGVWWSGSSTSKNSDVVGRNGLHWHPELLIFVKGVKQEIPANIGVGPQYAGAPGYDPKMKMAAVHTHGDLPLIHLEFMSGVVHKNDVELGKFFKIWGKDIHSFGNAIKMTVNGKENVEYEQYIMRDGDKIELHYD